MKTNKKSKISEIDICVSEAELNKYIERNFYRMLQKLSYGTKKSNDGTTLQKDLEDDLENCISYALYQVRAILGYSNSGNLDEKAEKEVQTYLSDCLNDCLISNFAKFFLQNGRIINIENTIQASNNLRDLKNIVFEKVCLAEQNNLSLSKKTNLEEKKYLEKLQENLEF